VTIEVRDGHQMTLDLWQELHGLYRSTFEHKSGWPTLSPGFFTEIGRTMPSEVIAILARHQGRIVAGTFNMRGPDTFYGRHWGCHQDFHSLHFEACYYRPLEYCIEQQMGYCEAGAQGEHKLSRGFLPVTTHSAHWIADPRFHRLIADFLEREQRVLTDYRELLHEHSPFRDATHDQDQHQQPTT
jgi:predicted N-acyltransferase